MRILVPFWYIGLFDRYLPQMKSISKRVEECHVAYIDEEPEQEWTTYFSFHKVDMPYGFVRSRMTRVFLSRRSLYNQIKDINVDVIYALSDVWAEEFARYCSRKRGLPYVVRLRGNSKGVREAMRISWYKKMLLNHLETRCLKDANLVIPISRRLARVTREWGIEMDRISKPVPIGVDVEVFRPMDVERSSEFTVGYAGRISPEKGVNRLVKVAEKLPDVHFIIAGKRQMDLTFPDNVEYLGEIPFSEIATFYNKVDIIVLPSFTEGFPLVILEAYACEKPVLVAKAVFPQELEVFGSVADISEFEREIKRLREVDLKPAGRKARKYVNKNYTWEKFGRSMVELLESVVD